MDYQFINIIDSFLESNILNQQFIINDSLKGYICKREVSKNDFVYEFISDDLLYSIKCINDKSFSNLNVILNHFYEIEISDFIFDFLTIEKDKKNLDYNLIIKINDFYLGIDRFDKKAEYDISNTMNINTESKLFEKMNNAFFKHIQKIITDYSNIYGKYDINAENFIFNSFNKKKNISIIQMIAKIFHIKSEGYLLISKEGVDYPFKYFYKNLLLNKNYNYIDWEILFKENPSLKEKYNLFKPEEVSLKDIDENYMKQHRELFLHNKTKRDNTKKEEKEELPFKIKKIDEFYSDINKNIGNSLIEKYILFKKYISKNK